VLIAEAFVLLALDADGKVARGASYQPYVAVGVTGALITELAQEGHVELTDGVIHLTGTRPTHPLLAGALDHLAPFEGKKLKGKLASVKKAGWSQVVDAMVASGALGRERSGLRPTRHPVRDIAGRERLLAQIREAATGFGRLDPHTATLLALAGPCQMLEVIAPARDDRAKAKKRIAAAATQVPAAAAVEQVVAAMHAAVAASTIGPVISSS
jgi:hypothetical protein